MLARTDDAKQSALHAALQGAPRRVIRQIAKQQLAHNAGPASQSGPAAAYGGYTNGADEASEPSDAAGNAGESGAAFSGERVYSGYTASAGRDAHDPARTADTRVATAPTEAGVRDVADLAGELGLTIELRELQLTRLIRAALEAQTGTLDLQAFIRAARADLRRADALVRAAPRL